METIFTQKKFGKHQVLAETQSNIVGVKFFAAILLLLISAALKTYAQAPNISYASPQSYNVGTTISPLSPTNTGGAVPLPGAINLPGTYSNPQGVAVDLSGNIYIADFANNVVEELPFGASSPITIGSGFSSPAGVAVDASGNVYVTDNGNHAIKKIPAGNGAVVTIATGFGSVYGIALDGHGFMYVTDATNNVAIKIPVGGGTQQAVGTGFNAPTGIAVDASGNVYVADRGNNAIKKVLASNGSTVTLATASGDPNGVAVDAAGNIYFVDNKSTAVTELQVGVTSATVLASSGLQSPASIAADNHGHVFVGDGGGHFVQQITLNGYSISPALLFGLVFDNTTGIISGSPEVAAAAANYQVTATNASGSSSAAINITVHSTSPPSISYSSPQTYVIGAAIPPLSPVNSGGNVPVPVPVALPGSFKPNGIAVDASGNIYFSQGVNVFEILAGNGSVIPLGSGFLQPEGLAVDAAGNVYVADAGSQSIKKIPAGNGTVTPVLSGLNGINDIALDGKGNIFGTTGSMVVKTSVNNGGVGSPQTVASGFINSVGIAIDTAGNVFANDEGANLIKEIRVTGGYFVYALTPGGADGLAIDKADNLYVSSSQNTSVFVIPGDGGNGYTIGSDLSRASGLAFDQQGHLFIGDVGAARIKRLDLLGYSISPAVPLGINFDHATGVITGTPLNTMAAKNYTVTAKNLAGSGTASVNIKFSADAPPAISYAGPQTYTVGLPITPLNPVNTGGALLTQPPVPLLGLFANPIGVATDPSGNIYVADAQLTQITKITADGSSKTAAVTHVLVPQGVAVDGSGNIYIADDNNKSIDKVAPGTNTLVKIATGFGNPYGIALAGNYLYVTDRTNQQVKRIPVGGGAAVLIGTGFSAPMGIAVDGPGNVYVADRGNNAVMEILASNGSTVSVATGHGGLTGVAVDAAGDVYFTDSKLTTITELPVGGGPAVAIGSGFSALSNLAIYKGHIFVEDHAQIKELFMSGFTINPALPAGLSFNNTTGAISGQPVVTSPATNYAITATNPGGRSTATVNITVNPASSNANLSSIGSSVQPITPSFNANTTSYTASVPFATTSMTVKPVVADATATIKVNGTTVASGSTSPPIALAAGASTAINIVVTAQNGGTKTYTLTVTRAPSTNAILNSIGPSITPLTPAFTAANTSYTLSAGNGVSSMTVRPMTSDANATMTVNGTALASGTTSAPIALAEGTTTAINIAVTAQDGTTTKTYTISVTRAPSANASLASMNPSITPLTPTFTPATTSYTLSVANSVSSMTVRPISSDANAAIAVNGTANPSGTTSAPIALAVGSNTISVEVTAQDGTTTRTYTITVTRASGGADSFSDGISVTRPAETPALAEDGIVIHDAISPNGDGINDFLQIENINQYPDNKLTIMNRSGQLIYEAKGYDNSSKTFDGHSNKNGKMQLPGTYFYQLDYTVKGIAKHKTGFIVLKY